MSRHLDRRIVLLFAQPMIRHQHCLNLVDKVRTITLFDEASCARTGPSDAGGTGPKTWACLRDNKGLGTAGFLVRGGEFANFRHFSSNKFYRLLVLYTNSSHELGSVIQK
jgi:hypothetical protein